MPGPDGTHWLHRLTAPEWLAAARTELTQAEGALERRANRVTVAHARRAAGMAWNAVLVDHPDERAGRSYMDHVTALCADPAAPDEIRAAARVLRESSTATPALVVLSRPGAAADEVKFVCAARAIVEHASRVVTPS